MPSDRRKSQPAAAVVTPGALGLLQHLRDGKARSRGRLAELSGVARSTAGIKVDELIAAGLVEEGAASYTGGRPSAKVQLLPRARVVLAVDIGATHSRVAVADLLGTVIAEQERTLDPDDEPASVLEWMLGCATQLCRDLEIEITRIGAVGIGLAAPIERETGRPVDPPIMPLWRDFDVRSWLAPHISVPILVEKDVNIMALGEFVSNPAGRSNMIFAKISTGIGAGVMTGGALQRGEQGLAGDIGHVRVENGGSTPCHCGNVGCLEAIASGPALAAALTAKGIEARTSQDVVELVRKGNLEAMQLVRQAGRDLGEVLAMCVSLLNPATIILGGTLADAGENLLAGVREGVYARSMPLAAQTLTITHAESGSSAALRGAAALAIDHLLLGTNRES
ncbi:MAG: ROK family transcriptional regulator [Agrococcus casei]|uniref:ROK family transcriptional regulator n=1 Tax=Agrococcus casei TaxID=343512 RepID=UPI003F931907